MAWTDLTFAYGSKLTSTQMTQLDDNFDALAAGDSGHPEIETAALKDLAVTTAKIAANAVTLDKLNFTQGSWSTVMGSSSTAKVDIQEYSHNPEQRLSAGTDVTAWAARALTGSLEHMLAASSSAGGTWAGAYYYHANSEQIIEVLREKLTALVVGIHVREYNGRGKDMPTIKRYDNNGVEIDHDIEIYTSDTTPSLFDKSIHKRTLSNAEDLKAAPEKLIFEIARI